ncbi:MAG TPA: hypothetical protein VGK39_00890, partial [Cyclobacteriaceae bacterium]
MKPVISCILAFSLIIFSACSPPSQREQYEEATSGLKYNAYKNASKAAILGSTEIYNRQQPDSLQIHPPYAHLLLGYFWSVSGKSSFAFAEADIVQEKGNDRNDAHVKSLAQSLRSITMYQAGWHQLANEESAKAKSNAGTDKGSKNEAAVMYLLMGTVYAKEKDFEKAKFFWGAFATETGIHWPYQICDATADFQAGNVQQGLQKVKIISQDSTVPKPIRDELALQIGKIEKQVGVPVNSSLFWPSIIGKMIWAELKNSSRQSVSKISNAIEDIGKKL